MRGGRRSRWVLGVTSLAAVVIVGHDVLWPPAGTAPPPAVQPEDGRREPAFPRVLDKGPLLYPSEFLAGLARRLAPALVAAAPREAGEAAGGFLVDSTGRVAVAAVSIAPRWTVTDALGEPDEAKLIATDAVHGVSLLAIVDAVDRPALAIHTGVPDAADGLVALQPTAGLPQARVVSFAAERAPIGVRLVAPLRPGEVVVDLDGRVRALATPDPGGVQLVDAATLAEIVSQLATTGRHAHPWFGATLQRIDDSLRPALPKGASVAVSVGAGSPAFQAGIRAGMTFGEVRTESGAVLDLQDLERGLAVGNTVTLTAGSGGRDLAVTVGDRQTPETPAIDPAGILLATTSGVPVGVAPLSAAARAGLRPGDRIEAVDLRAVTSESVLQRLLQRSRHRLLTVRRGDRRFLVAMPQVGAGAAASR
jgi:S1-C subfamily serine protease